MVSLIDRFIRGIRGIFGERTREISEPFQGIMEVPPGEEIISREFTRKFVSGLFYCGGEKVQYFGLTFEQNGTDRSDELLDAIEENVQQTCSDIRDNFGYEERQVDSSEARLTAIWPDIEVGEL